MGNAAEIFKSDHAPISFHGGRSKGENFEYATAIPFDIDNSHSDNPADWVKPKDIARRLQKLGINFWMVASRNHLREKDGKAARPKFHVYLVLSMPLHTATSSSDSANGASRSLTPTRR